MAAPEIDAGALAVRRIEPLAVIALRHLPGACDALAAALRAVGVAAIPAPGQVIGKESGHGAWALWRSPSEITLLTCEPSTAQAAVASLVHTHLACAVDQSQGTLALELQGQQVDELLQRLVDSRSVPIRPGVVTRARLADIAVTLLRQQTDTLWLLADRSHEHYLISWFSYAGAAVAQTAT